MILPGLIARAQPDYLRQLNALSGDHYENPLQLQDGLRFKFSDLNRVIQVQNG